jgi:PAS domain-containing protein
MPEPGGVPPALVERARLSEILDAMTARICVVGADRRYRYANRAFAEFHRLPPEEIVGRSTREVLGAAAAGRVEPWPAARWPAKRSSGRAGWSTAADAATSAGRCRRSASPRRARTPSSSSCATSPS